MSETSREKTRGRVERAGAVKNRKDAKRFGVVCLCVTAAAAAAAGRAAIAVISPRPICSGVVFFFFFLDRHREITLYSVYTLWTSSEFLYIFF